MLPVLKAQLYYTLSISTENLIHLFFKYCKKKIKSSLLVCFVYEKFL